MLSLGPTLEWQIYHWLTGKESLVAHFPILSEP